MKRRRSSDSRSEDVASKNAFSSPRKSDNCRCMAEPFWSASGFGMNEAYTSCCIATSLTISRKVMTESAMVSASV